MITNINWIISDETLDFTFSNVENTLLSSNRHYFTDNLVWRITYNKVFMMTEFNRFDIDMFFYDNITGDEFFDGL